MSRFTQSRAFWIILLTILSALALLSAAGGVRNALRMSQDFQYDAAKALLLGYDPYDLSLYGGEAEIPELREFYGYFEDMGTPQRMEANQFPSLLYILAPYAVLPYRIAKILWLITNLLCTALIAFLLRRTFLRSMDSGLFAAFLLLMTAGTPWRNQLGVGQHTLFAFMFFLLAVLLEEKGKNPVLTGAVLSLSYLKYTVTAPLALYFIYKRKWKEFAVSLIPHFAGTVAAAAVLKEPFTDMIRKPLAVASALTGEGSIDIGVLTGGASQTPAITVLIMAVLLFAAYRLKPGHDCLLMAVLVLYSLIMTYHRTYDFFVLITAAGAYAEEAGLRGNGEKPGIWEWSAILFVVLLAFVFFGLRFVHEAAWSLAAAAMLYYLYVICVSAKLIGRLKNGA